MVLLKTALAGTALLLLGVLATTMLGQYVTMEVREVQRRDVEPHSEFLVGDFVENERYLSPADVMIEKSLQEDINTILATLSEKEAEILQYRFGLNGRRPMSLKEIGDKYMLTKERIRQIEKKAIKRLQHPTRSQLLKSYVHN